MRFKTVLKIWLLTLFIFLFQGCSLNQSSLSSVIQTNSATLVATYRNEVLKDLKEYKRKLDLRNPYSYNQKLSKNIYTQISSNQDYINIIQDGYKLETANEYLYYAFTQNDIENRNDFLILGMYKLIYKAFDLENKHQFIASQYNKKYMQELYTYLQVIRWKVRHDKDFKGEYLFNTWQNNWQLELMKKDSNNLNIIKELEYIKNKKESIFNHSNFTFETLMERLLLNVKYSLRQVDVEPYELSISAIKSFAFII
ncbi:hypothetical protein [Arcobacter sp. YIC-310]|uniref:hypothetical protein n=1 Tax=Arcobacter sp. YIC-310 TaxID=3376632 RepID=UPI003C25C911